MNRLLLAGAALPLLALSTVPAFAAATTSFLAPHVWLDPRPLLLVALIAVAAIGFFFHLRAPIRAIACALLALLIVSIGLDVAFAAESAPETVAQSVGESAKVTWAWGATVSQWLQALAWFLLSIGMYFARQLPANLVAVFGNARVELLLRNAINYGINAVAGAVKDKTLEVRVGNEVLAKALQYAVDNAPAWLQQWAGGPEGLAKKIWGRLNLGEGASDAAIDVVVQQVEQTKS